MRDSPIPSDAAARLLAVEGAINRVVVAVASLLLALAALTGFYQVIARFVLSQPSTWSEVLVRTLLVWMVYLGAVGAIRAGALLSVDVLYNLARGRVRRVLQAFVSLATLTLLAVMLWFGIEMGWRVRFQNLAGLEISIAWGYAAIPIGSALGMVSVVAHFFDSKRLELETAQ
jgi:TRAP-type C4-dicarboxylate transport system permease small subunit